MRYFLVSIVAFFFISCSSKQQPIIHTIVPSTTITNIDTFLTLVGYDQQNRNNHIKAISTFGVLFNNTKVYQYLISASKSIQGVKSANLFLSIFSKYTKDKLLIINTLLKAGKFELANTNTKKIFKKNKSIEVYNYMFLSHLFLKQYQQSLPYIEYIYKKYPNILNLSKLIFINFKNKNKSYITLAKRFIEYLNKNNKIEILSSSSYIYNFIKEDSILLNAYGYFLIDKNLDIKQGLYFVKQAIKINAHPAYLDSFAWGLYKQKKYQQALIIMKNIYEQMKTSKDFQEHYKQIKAQK